jgi:L-lactate utilization protein LutB
MFYPHIFFAGGVTQWSLSHFTGASRPEGKVKQWCSNCGQPRHVCSVWSKTPAPLHRSACTCGAQQDHFACNKSSPIVNG